MSSEKRTNWSITPRVGFIKPIGIKSLYIFVSFVSAISFAHSEDMAKSCMDAGIALEKIAIEENKVASESPRNKAESLFVSSVKHYKQALEKFICASKAGNHLASLKAARLMSSEIATDSNVVESYYLDAVNAGVIDDDLSTLGFYCGDSLAGCKNFKPAINWLNLAVKHRSPYAMNYLGQVYEKGEGVEKSIKKAFFYYQMAANMNYKIAQENACRLIKNHLYVDKAYMKTCP